MKQKRITFIHTIYHTHILYVIDIFSKLVYFTFFNLLLLFSKIQFVYQDIFSSRHNVCKDAKNSTEVNILRCVELSSRCNVMNENCYLILHNVLEHVLFLI